MRLRLALAGCVVIGCTLAGRSFAWASGRRKRLLEQALEALKMLRMQIVSLLEPLAEALRQSEFSLFAATAGRLPECPSASEAWKSVLSRETRRGGIADSLQKRELDALERLFERLGESGRAAQDDAIRACIASIEEALNEARTKSEQADRLCTSMGLLLGLTIAVLLA